MNLETEQQLKLGLQEGSVAQVAQQFEGSPVDLDQKFSVEPGGAGRFAGELKILLEENSEAVEPESERMVGESRDRMNEMRDMGS
eukprot:snap_masked-scaffold_70-processed-gene-0.1-mRNA-1 protein AED:1.00 eAED:1.00 QI:0/0/0/0/1/1/2/0/84